MEPVFDEALPRLVKVLERGEDFEVVGVALFAPCDDERVPARLRGDKGAAGRDLAGVGAQGDERVRHLAEGGADGGGVIGDLDVAPGLGGVEVGIEPPAGEERQRDLRLKTPNAGTLAEKFLKLGSRRADAPG